MTKKKPRPRSESERARDRKKIESLYYDGMTQTEIAEKMDLSQATISRDLKMIQKQWMKETTFNLDQMKAKQLATLDKLELEYWAAWERSKEFATIKIKNELGEEVTLFRAASNRTPFGSVQYLEGVQRCIQQRRAILGIDAPKKKEHRFPDGIPSAIIMLPENNRDQNDGDDPDGNDDGKENN